MSQQELIQAFPKSDFSADTLSRTLQVGIKHLDPFFCSVAPDLEPTLSSPQKVERYLPMSPGRGPRKNDVGGNDNGAASPRKADGSTSPKPGIVGSPIRVMRPPVLDGNALRQLPPLVLPKSTIIDVTQCPMMVKPLGQVATPTSKPAPLLGANLLPSVLNAGPTKLDFNRPRIVSSRVMGLTSPVGITVGKRVMSPGEDSNAANTNQETRAKEAEASNEPIIGNSTGGRKRASTSNDKERRPSNRNRRRGSRTSEKGSSSEDKEKNTSRQSKPFADSKLVKKESRSPKGSPKNSPRSTTRSPKARAAHDDRVARHADAASYDVSLAEVSTGDSAGKQKSVGRMHSNIGHMHDSLKLRSTFGCPKAVMDRAQELESFINKISAIPDMEKDDSQGGNEQVCNDRDQFFDQRRNDQDHDPDRGELSPSLQALHPDQLKRNWQPPASQQASDTNPPSSIPRFHAPETERVFLQPANLATVVKPAFPAADKPDPTPEEIVALCTKVYSTIIDTPTVSSRSTKLAQVMFFLNNFGAGGSGAGTNGPSTMTGTRSDTTHMELVDKEKKAEFTNMLQDLIKVLESDENAAIERISQGRSKSSLSDSPDDIKKLAAMAQQTPHASSSRGASPIAAQRVVSPLGAQRVVSPLGIQQPSIVFAEPSTSQIVLSPRRVSAGTQPESGKDELGSSTMSKKDLVRQGVQTMAMAIDQLLVKYGTPNFEGRPDLPEGDALARYVTAIANQNAILNQQQMSPMTNPLGISGNSMMTNSAMELGLTATEVGANVMERGGAEDADKDASAGVELAAAEEPLGKLTRGDSRILAPTMSSQGKAGSKLQKKASMDLSFDTLLAESASGSLAGSQTLKRKMSNQAALKKKAERRRGSSTRRKSSEGDRRPPSVERRKRKSSTKDGASMSSPKGRRNQGGLRKSFETGASKRKSSESVRRKSPPRRDSSLGKPPASPRRESRKPIVSSRREGAPPGPSKEDSPRAEGRMSTRVSRRVSGHNALTSSRASNKTNQMSEIRSSARDSKPDTKDQRLLKEWKEVLQEPGKKATAAAAEETNPSKPRRKTNVRSSSASRGQTSGLVVAANDPLPKLQPTPVQGPGTPDQHGNQRANIANFQCNPPADGNPPANMQYDPRESPLQINGRSPMQMSGHRDMLSSSFTATTELVCRTPTLLSPKVSSFGFLPPNRPVLIPVSQPITPTRFTIDREKLRVPIGMFSHPVFGVSANRTARAGVDVKQVGERKFGELNKDTLVSSKGSKVSQGSTGMDWKPSSSASEWRAVASRPTTYAISTNQWKPSRTRAGSLSSKDSDEEATRKLGSTGSVGTSSPASVKIVSGQGSTTYGQRLITSNNLLSRSVQNLTSASQNNFMSASVNNFMSSSVKNLNLMSPMSAIQTQNSMSARTEDSSVAISGPNQSMNVKIREKNSAVPSSKQPPSRAIPGKLIPAKKDHSPREQKKHDSPKKQQDQSTKGTKIENSEMVDDSIQTEDPSLTNPSWTMPMKAKGKAEGKSESKAPPEASAKSLMKRRSSFMQPLTRGSRRRGSGDSNLDPAEIAKALAAVAPKGKPIVPQKDGPLARRESMRDIMNKSSPQKVTASVNDKPSDKSSTVAKAPKTAAATSGVKPKTPKTTGARTGKSVSKTTAKPAQSSKTSKTNTTEQDGHHSGKHHGGKVHHAGKHKGKGIGLDLGLTPSLPQSATYSARGGPPPPEGILGGGQAGGLPGGGLQAGFSSARGPPKLNLAGFFQIGIPQIKPPPVSVAPQIFPPPQRLEMPPGLNERKLGDHVSARPPSPLRIVGIEGPKLITPRITDLPQPTSGLGFVTLGETGWQSVTVNPQPYPLSGKPTGATNHEENFSGGVPSQLIKMQGNMSFSKMPSSM